MSNATVCNVNDIQSDKKACLEGLLGRELQADQQVFIMVFTPSAVPDESARRAAASKISETIRAAGKDAAERGITSDEADAAVAEASESHPQIAQANSS